jgi:hypothetical protein
MKNASHSERETKNLEKNTSSYPKTMRSMQTLSHNNTQETRCQDN